MKLVENFFLTHEHNFLKWNRRHKTSVLRYYTDKTTLLGFLVVWTASAVESNSQLSLFKIENPKTMLCLKPNFFLDGNQNLWEGLINWSMKPLEDFCASFLTWLKRKLQRPKRKKRHFSCRASVKDHLQSLHDIESSSPKTKLNQSELCATYLSWWNLSVQVIT